MGKFVKHRAPKWQACEVLRLPEDGGLIRAITNRAVADSYTYHPVWLPGEPQTGDTVQLCYGGYFCGLRQHRCRVAGREYAFIGNGPVWQDIETGEIICRPARIVYLGEEARA